MKSVAFIIPGFTHTSKNKGYEKVAELFRKKKIVPIFIPISWSNSTLSDNIKYFQNIYRATQADKKYIFGFSFGAMIGLIASTQEKPDAQILCSLSPYFQEDLSKIKKSWRKIIGKNRFSDFQQYSAAKIVKNTKTKTILLYGTEEVEQLKNRVKRTFDGIKVSKKLIPIEKAKHDIGDLNYLRRIQLSVDSLK